MPMTFRTSGTTGEPKIVEVSDAAIEERLALYAEHLPIKPGERVLKMIPPGKHANNFSTVGSLMHPERCGAFVETRHLDYADFLRSGGFNVVFAIWDFIPPALKRLREPIENGPRLFVIGANPFSEEQRQMILQKFPNTTVVSNYGSSECGVMALTDGGPIKPHCVGKPIVPTKVVDGEVYFSGDTLADQYASGKPIKDCGWFRQGDKAEMIDGELYIYGRA